jgi:hypothetical protein
MLLKRLDSESRKRYSPPLPAGHGSDFGCNSRAYKGPDAYRRPDRRPIRLPFAVNNSTMVHPQEVDIIVAGGGSAGN